MDLQTTQQTPLRLSVSQLAKTPIFLLKTSNEKALRVGRQHEKTSHTSAHAPTPPCAPDFKEQNLDFKALNYLNGLFSNLQSNTKVVFHNNLYVKQIEATYNEQESALFLQFVKIFAQFRKADRQEPINNVLLTNESDFLLAFKLLKQRKIEQYAHVKDKNKHKVFDLLIIKFKCRTFSAQILAKELFYNYSLLNNIITLLLLERKIEFVSETAGQLFYRLREKSNVYVTCN